ncbi:expressed protein [Phakopsora pachyrhizi]|uniref:Expressed protein n=1 Tax=Phakopsora pachyrhizi TaxID=170000 RepID=A0AAV0BTK7_PHAPC|nr:expressed protein [Phakopsora pachyrhizi]
MTFFIETNLDNLNDFFLADAPPLTNQEVEVITNQPELHSNGASFGSVMDADSVVQPPSFDFQSLIDNSGLLARVHGSEDRRRGKFVDQRVREIFAPQVQIPFNPQSGVNHPHQIFSGTGAPSSNPVALLPLPSSTTFVLGRFTHPDSDVSPAGVDQNFGRSYAHRAEHFLNKKNVAIDKSVYKLVDRGISTATPARPFREVAQDRRDPNSNPPESSSSQHSENKSLRRSTVDHEEMDFIAERMQYESANPKHTSPYLYGHVNPLNLPKVSLKAENWQRFADAVFQILVDHFHDNPSDDPKVNSQRQQLLNVIGNCLFEAITDFYNY